MTGLHYHFSQRIESLAGELASRIERERAGDPFAPSQVAVGSGGMERWLERALALRWGVAANVRFSRPTMLFERALAELEGARAAGEAFWPGSLRFAILGLLRELADEVPEANDLARLSDGARYDRASLGMARALADSVDRLVHYRPRLLWEGFAGELAAEYGSDPALPLMREIVQRLEARLGPTHLAARTLRVKREAGPVEALHPPLHVFGVSFLPPLYFELLALLAERRAVHLYALVPSEEYFADTASKRDRWARELEGTFDVDLPILAGWAGMSREFLHLAYSLGVHQAEEQLLFEEPPGEALLHAVQRDLRTLAPAPSPGHALDASVEVHACFGPLRQVEALRERLLAAFAADPSLEPWEVAILTPDVSVYGPLVLSVFSSARDGLPEIPVELADVSLVHRAPAAEFLVRFARFAAGRPTATALADLLEHRAAATRFGLDEADLPLVRALLEASAMRYGTGDEPEGEVPVSPLHTLRAGLRRITLGALYPDGAAAVAGLSPLPGLDGEHLRVGLALAEAVEVYLAHRARLREGPRTVEQWVNVLLAILTDVFPDDGAGRAEVARELGGLRREAEGFEGALTLDAIVAELTERLQDLGERMHAVRGGVVVSRLSPMRAVPYRVVALLGLDEGAFPRREKQPSFDLVAKRPKVGDREASVESRHLLLEALLAARERFLLFYGGRDARTLEVIPPPTAVEDLLETLSRMTGTPRDPAEAHGQGRVPLVVEHPLQPFGAFSPALPEAARSHSRVMRDAAARLLRERTPPPGPFPEGVRLEREAPEIIALDDLVRFFRDPPGALLARELRVRFPEEASSLDEREPLELDHRERWNIRDELLRAQLAGDEGALEALVARHRAEGNALAHGLDEVVAEAQWRDVEQILEAQRDLGLALSLGRAPVEVELELEGGQRVLVVGEAPAPNERALVLPLASKSPGARHLVKAMLEAVCLTLAREPRPVEAVHILVADRKNCASLGLPAAPARWLGKMVEVYLEGRVRALRLFSAASLELAKKILDGNEPHLAARAASEAYVGKPGSPVPGEADAPAARVLFPSDPFFEGPDERPSEEAIALACEVYGPILEARR